MHNGSMATLEQVVQFYNRGGNFQNQEQNCFHSLSISDDGERAYVAGTTAGFEIG